jgi:UDP-N-acetylglucosamine--N-acetylmuramyl-(pentapeptide) pyrophosphoryl-undecaprenol N-acetylglucosamine transferase
VAAGYWQCRRLFKGRRPDKVVSAGGFVAVPAVWAARSLGVPVHIHQMDIRPGLANRLSAPFASSVSVAFRKSLDDFEKHNPVWVGNPVRSEALAGERNAGLARFRLVGDRPVVLLLGGGTGAESLNRLVIKAWDYLKDDIDFIHVTGPGKGIVVAADEHYRQEESLSAEEMGLAYAVADLVVTRAGMGTLTELAALGRATVIVPIPGSHQEDNAAFFAVSHAAEVWPENELFSKGFADRLLRLARDQGRRDNLASAIHGLSRPDAAERLADMVLSAG